MKAKTPEEEKKFNEQIPKVHLQDSTVGTRKEGKEQYETAMLYLHKGDPFFFYMVYCNMILSFSAYAQYME